MSALPEPLVRTVEQYRQLPRGENLVQELHWGQVVDVTRPKMKHAKLQYKLVRVLRPLAEHVGVIDSEVAFRALPEYELRAADVAFVSQQRWDETPDDDNLRGSPELVIEILSPSNTQPGVREKLALCLSTGAQECWVIDPVQRSLLITRQSGQSQFYSFTGETTIPLPLFNAAITLADIFN